MTDGVSTDHVMLCVTMKETGLRKTDRQTDGIESTADSIQILYRMPPGQAVPIWYLYTEWQTVTGNILDVLRMQVRIMRFCFDK